MKNILVLAGATVVLAGLLYVVGVPPLLIPIILAALAALIYVGLPKLMILLGVHPHYYRREFDLQGRKAMVICTSHGTLDPTDAATGVYGSEMTAPYYQFLDAGMQVDIVSPLGGEVPIEPASLKWPVVTAADKRFLKDDDYQHKIKNSLKIEDIDFTDYDIVFMAGGWGAAYDLGYSEALGEKGSEAYAAGAVLGSVCHGALGLLNIKDETGKPLVQGLNVTGVSNKQVHEVGVDVTPQHPETELRKAGAIFNHNTAFKDFFADLTVVDGRVVTGQNQNAGAETAQKMMMVAEKQS